MFEKFHRGDIYSADLSPGIGSEQSGSRPVLILQNNVGNCFSPTIIIAAITSVSKKSRKFPTHYHLNDRCGLVKPSVVMLEQIRTIDKSRLKNYIGHLNKDDMENINKTLLCSLGITQKCRKVVSFSGCASRVIISLGIAEVILNGEYPE